MEQFDIYKDIAHRFNGVYGDTFTIPEGYTIIALGPLTSPEFSKAIQEFCGEDYLYFFDSVAPIITEKSMLATSLGKYTFEVSMNATKEWL